ncbi:MAG: DUF502 domain-containing protein [Candidatus Nitrohelix vancouverensis]|uniref:DUF502 domain-containing protein n=1 Tax=Candidatus Nitrohelix vancouverensis TaxID=2705534 RepID=A0A7T0G3E7_9BACT|nr:MAG: DUF502 domain-containing protein [Candidatus Nitrohelix vancouverensis]
MKSIKSAIKKNMIAGLLITVPAALTYIILRFIVNNVDQAMAPVIDKFIGLSNWSYLEENSIPGTGLLIIFLFILLVGLLVTNFLGRKLVEIGENLLNKIPFVRAIYTSIKKVIHTISQTETPSFERMVLLTYPRVPLKTLGIVCCDARGEIVQNTRDKMVNVFVPTSPNPTTGYLLIVPIEDVDMLTMTVEDGLKMIISFGMVTIAEGAPGAVTVDRKEFQEMAEQAQVANKDASDGDRSA